MRPLQQISKKIKVLFQYLCWYLSGSFFVISLFAFIYEKNKISDPFKLSFRIFWTLESNFPPEIEFLACCETIAYDLFSVVLVGTILVQLLQPLNPIHFADFVVYDTVDRKMSFRYWIMLPKGKYLYDVKLKILLTDYESHQTGVNKLEVFWQPDDDKLNLDQIRGIRFVELNEKESSDLFKSIEIMIQKHINEKGQYIGGHFSIDFSIRGTSENGITYYGWHQYKHGEILLGYRHVPLQRHSYDTEDFYREAYLPNNKFINASKDFYEAGKKEFFRYQHFNKVYRLLNSHSPSAQKNILTKNQIIHGEYSGIRQLFLDLTSFWIWFFLDSDRKVFWCFHKASEYLLHVLHLRRY